MPPLTAAAYRTLPETGPRYQLIQGDLHVAPAPNRFHQDISRNLELILGNYLARKPLGVLYDAPFDVYLDETNVFQPDILFISNARAAILADDGAHGAPDFIVEILSPKTAHIDLHVKRLQYARAGVDELWIIDPEARTLTIFRLQENPGSPTAILEESQSATSAHFPGLTIPLAGLFRQ